jgi:hypothetical protein
VAAAEVGITGIIISLRTWKTKKTHLGGKVLLRWAEGWRARTTILILVPPETASGTGIVRTEGAAAVDRISEARTSPLEAVPFGPLATLATLFKEILDEAEIPEVVVASNRTGSLRGGSTTWNLRKIAINMLTSVGHTSKTAAPGVV